MFTITAEILRLLGIDNCYLGSEKTEFCFITKIISIHEWEMRVSCPLTEEQTVLHIRFRDEYVTIPVNFYCEVSELTYRFFIKEIPSALAERITSYEEERKKAFKRSEQRYSVGMTGSKLFGLSGPEQRVYIKGKEKPCLINNVSLHGVQFLSYADDAVQSGEHIYVIQMQFLQPLEMVVVKGILMRIEKQKELFSMYSLKLIDPVCESWRERIQRYSKIELEKKTSN